MFTKVYKEEDEKLRGCSYNIASVYFHLKNKRDYFKTDSCYDLTRCISGYMGISEITIKRAIATLKEIGLISTYKKGKVNIYSFPILDKIEGKTPQNTTEVSTLQQVEEKPAEPTKITIEEEIEVANNNTDDMGTFIGDFKELNSKTTATTTQNVVEEKYDDFSNELKRLLNEYKGVIDQLTTMIAKANMSDDVCVVSTAKMAEMRIKNISKQLVAEIDKTNYRGYIDEKIETKTKKLQVA
jgi:hypothetical protein